MKYHEYIFEGYVKFSASGETLSLLEHPDSFIVLTPACSRLLVFLISNQGVVLSRDTIFLSLWENYGGTPSNSSLNTYISLIRKAFITLGYNGEIITTIPKTGFLLNPDISIDKISNAITACECDDKHCEEITYLNEVLSQEDTFSKESMGSGVNIKLKKKNPFAFKKSPSNAKYHIRQYLKPLSFALTFIILYLLSHIEPDHSITPIKAGKMNDCDIMILSVHTGDSITLSFSQLKYIIKKTGFSCNNKGLYYVYADKNVTTRHKGKVYVSYCEYNNDKIRRCVDFIRDNFTLPNLN